ncbi:MAG: methyl-accepting chemotaxis protein [Nitrospirota bacterium]|nr:methyl-accepting chemotaxis protein [Nitrospirota bacterium]
MKVGFFPAGWRLHLGPGARILLAVLLMGVALLLTVLPLIRGLEQNARMEIGVTETLVPNSMRVITLATSVLEAQSALERFLMTQEEDQGRRFASALRTTRTNLTELKSFGASGEGVEAADRSATVAGIMALVDKLEQQGQMLFEMSHRDDNIPAAHLINTTGEALMTRNGEAVDQIARYWSERGSAEDQLALSALMGYQDSLSRMMSAVRGYLYMKDGHFKGLYREMRQRNDRIFSGLEQQSRQAGAPLQARFTTLAATRTRLLGVFDQAMAARDAAGWRRDIDFYTTQVVPTLHSLQLSVQTVSSTSSQGISRVIDNTSQHGLDLKSRAVFSVALLTAVGALLAFWIHRWVGVFNHEIFDAAVALGKLAEQVRVETGDQALEARHQVQEMDGVFLSLGELEQALGRIGEQTEHMAQQTDTASLECVQGMEVLAYSQDRMAAILQQVREITTAMDQTKSQTNRMDGILAILNELVDQTKLLSFNATIEAAGAGESGARFAVVAQQVRRLATRARESTQEIHEMIRRVQRTSEEARLATERGAVVVNEGENLMRVVTERLDQIVGAVGQVSDIAGGVFLATQAQTKTLGRVNQFVGEAKETATRVDQRSQQSLETAARLDATSRNLSALLGGRMTGTQAAGGDATGGTQNTDA